MSTLIIQWEPQTTFHNQSKDIPANNKQLSARASSNALLTTNRTTKKSTKRRKHGNITLNRLTSWQMRYIRCLYVNYLYISWPNLGFMPRRLKSGYSSGWSKRLKAICQLSANHWGKQTLCFHLMLTNISSIHQTQDMHRNNMHAHFFYANTTDYWSNKLAKVDHESWYMLQYVVIMYTPLYFVSHTYTIEYLWSNCTTKNQSEVDRNGWYS